MEWAKITRYPVVTEIEVRRAEEQRADEIARGVDPKQLTKIPKLNREAYAAANYCSPVDGKLKRRTATGTSPANAAQRLEAKLRAMSSAGVDSFEASAIAASENVLRGADTVANLVRYTLAKKERSVQPQSMLSYRSNGKHITRIIGNLRIVDFNSAAVDRVLNELMDEANRGNTDAAGRSVWKPRPTAAKRCRIIMRQMIDLAIGAGALKSGLNPLAGTIEVQVKAPDAAEIVTVTAEETKQILDAVDAWRRGPGVYGTRPDGQLGDLFRLQAGSALRIGEALALTRNAVIEPTAFDPHWRVHIAATIVALPGENRWQDHTKTVDSRRIIPVTGLAEEALRTRMAATAGEPGSSPLFPSRVGTFRQPANLMRVWAAIREAHPEIPWIWSHVWRHTAATAAAKVDREWTRAWLGHSPEKKLVLETNYARRDISVSTHEEALAAIRRATMVSEAESQNTVVLFDRLDRLG